MLAIRTAYEKKKYNSTLDKVEFMWIDTKDSNKCSGVCQDGTCCNNNKINGNFCYAHKEQNVAYLTS